MSFFSRHLLYVLIIGIGSSICGLGIAYYSPAGEPLQKELNLNPTQANIFNTLHPLFGILGGPINNFLIPLLGRKKMTFTISVVSFISWILLGVTKLNYYWLAFLARSLMGICTGGFSGVCSMYIVETAPSKYRGSYGVIHQLMITLGIVWVYFLGIFCIWRTLAFVCMISPLLLCILIWFVPESPANQEETDVEKESLLQKKFFPPLFSSFLLIVFQQFSGINPILTNLEKIFKDANIQISPAVCSLITGIAQVIATLIASFVIHKLGRRPSWIVSSAGQMLALFLIWAQELWKINPFLSLVSLFTDVFFFGIAFGPVPWMIVPELFPDSVRTLAVSIMTGLNWLISSATVFVWPFITEKLTPSWSFFLFGCFCTCAAIYGFFFMPETKGKEMGEDAKNYNDDRLNSV
ncbi:major facilitator superfamily transporter [Histomonas meleagridis]|uniref:major facilitator superfamily transporter n=1 Tax=Histomonas meleagridis TaxID=135588 RepID=UPI003559DC0C|nr:major facilitator superfamily transporter [Histomonas meleagridis]KAH0797430.1 major facilitator superfamily transporter [Histomonas meleagridis]